MRNIFWLKLYQQGYDAENENIQWNNWVLWDKARAKKCGTWLFQKQDKIIGIKSRE